jgi:hypothetical protein
LYAEQLKETPVDHPPAQTRRAVNSSEVEGLTADRRHPLERSGAFPPVAEVRIGDEVPPACAPFVRQQHQAVRFVVRQRAQQQCMYYAENRRVRANAQAEGEYGNQREARVLE